MRYVIFNFNILFFFFLKKKNNFIFYFYRLKYIYQKIVVIQYMEYLKIKIRNVILLFLNMSYIVKSVVKNMQSIILNLNGVKNVNWII
jgi:hypothetical protein